MPFWLKVKKEYILENFEELIEYLSHYHYDRSLEDPSYTATVDCLREMAADIATGLDTGSLPYPTTTSLRLLGATLLAGKRSGLNMNEELLTMVTALVTTQRTTNEEILEDMVTVVTDAARGGVIKSFAFGWDDIASENFSSGMLALKVAKTRFEKAGGHVSLYVENRGLAVVNGDGKVEVAAMNLNAFKKEKLKAQMSPMPGIEIVVKERDHEKKSDFATRYNLATSLVQSQLQVKPSPVTRLKEYSKGDTLIVRVKDVISYKIVAESIDERYAPVTGNVFVKSNAEYRPADDLIRSKIRPGSIIKVKMFDDGGKTAFSFTDALEDYYRSVAEQYGGEKVLLTFDRRYHTGSQWISEEGIRVAFDNKTLQDLSDEENELIERAIDEERVIIAVMQGEVMIDGGRCYVYADYPVDEEVDPIDEFNRLQADSRLIDDFIAEARDEADEMKIDVAEYIEASPRLLPALTAITAAMAEAQNGNSMTQLEFYCLTAMLGTIGSFEKTRELAIHSMRYLSRAVAFASNGDVKSLEHGSEIEGDAGVENREAIVKALQRYRKPTTLTATGRMSGSTDNRLERVERLITASNDLVDIIDDVELDTIKQNITRVLGTDDEYVSIVDERTCYGSENANMEFKKSIVFPPANRRRSPSRVYDPELQKWAIFKTVCGFLNSRNGGVLLLGVNDNGYADGVDDDIAALYKNKAIVKPDADTYALYVQKLIDEAFDDYGTSANGGDITKLNIAYEMETNAEKKTIMRISVTPYRYGAVRIKAAGRPEGYFESYVRRSRNTEPLTPALLDEVNSYKLQQGDDTLRDMVKLCTAAREKRVVILRGYRSASGKSDREIEVYQAWGNRNVIYGYDTVRRRQGLFKVTRAESVEITERKWSTARSQRNVELDPFGFIIDGLRAFEIKMYLSDFARMIMLEELPDAAGHIKPTAASEGPDLPPWTFTCRASTTQGAARFAMGMADNVTVAKDSKLYNEMQRQAMLIVEN